MAVSYCGLDVGSSVCHITAKSLTGEKLHVEEIPTAEKTLRELVEKIPGEERHFHLEAGELAAWIRRILLSCPRVKRVLVSNPKRNSWIAKDAHKSDSIDSDKLADLLRTGMVDQRGVFYPDDPKSGIFKQIVQLYEKMTREQASTKMRIKAFLRTQGVIAKGESVYLKEGRMEFVERIPFPAAKNAALQLFTLLDHLLDVQAMTKRSMLQEGKASPQIARFKRVPGVGPINASRFVAYLQDPHRFKSKRQLWSYARLGICHRSSNGETVGRVGLDWNGNGSLKDVARKTFEAAMKRREDNLFKRTYEASLRRTKIESHARLNTMRKILAVLLAMWKEGTEFQDSKG
jgi:transposase